MTTLAVIPSRYDSSRFPGKPLANIHGKPMIQWVWEAVNRSKYVDITLVATDDERIESVVTQFGGKAIMTDKNCFSGTDRVASVLKQLDTDFDLVLNVQGDEPTINTDTISNVIRLMNDDRSFDIGTVACKFLNLKEIFDPNIVKVVTDDKNRALYFSRSPIPYVRNENIGSELGFPLDMELLNVFKRHIGIYAYRKGVIDHFTNLPLCQLEKLEMLEQLRALVAGLSIGVALTPHTCLGVDLPSDIKLVEQILSICVTLS